MAHSQQQFSRQVKPLVKLIDRLAYQHSRWNVFCDFVELMALTISLCSPVHWKERAEQLEAVKAKYTADELAVLAELIQAFGQEAEDCFNEQHLEDILGHLYEEMDLANEWHGQFFTPQSVADFMGLITATGHELPERGYETACEPCIGSGAMILGLINAKFKAGREPRGELVVTGVDIDLRCVHMAYIQLSVYGIPAVIIHGNTLTTEEWSRWYTPAYLAGNWIWRQRCGITTKFCEDDELLKRFTDPMYSAIRATERLFSDTSLPAVGVNPPDSKPKTESAPLREAKCGQMALF